MVSCSVLLVFGSKHVQVAGLLEHHRAAAGVERLDVVVDELGPLRQRLGAGVVRPHVGDAVAIGNEIHGVAEPRRIDILRIGPRRRDQVERLEVDDPHRAILAAAIVAALLVPRGVHAIRDAAAVGRNLALVAARQRHRLGDAALRRHRPESRRRIRRRRLPARREHDLRAVGRPALHGVGAGVPRQAHRLAAARPAPCRRRCCRA